MTLKCVQCKNYDKDKKICYDGVYFQPDVQAVNGTFLAKDEDDVKDYLAEVQQKTDDAVDVVKCNQDEPYSNGEKCFACPEDKNLFDLESKECSNCPEGYNHNSETQICEKAPAEVKPVEPANETKPTNITNVGGNTSFMRRPVYVVNPEANGTYLGESK